jgi:hypothetical protein
VGEARVTQSLSLVLAGLSIASALSCSVLDGPRQASISLAGPRTVMAGDVVHLTAKINGAMGATSAWNASDFRQVAIVGETNTSVDIYGVGVGEGWVRLSLEDRNAGGSLTQIAKDSIPITVTAPPPSNRPAFSQIEVGEHEACGLATDGSGFCWGNTRAFHQYAPSCENDNVVHVLPRVCNAVPLKLLGVPQFKSLDIGSYSTCGITIADDTYCWGIAPNTVGNVNGDPAIVPGGIKFTRVSVQTGLPLNLGEPERVCGIANDGRLYCWIRGGNPTDPSVLPGSGYKAIAVGGVSVKYRACALDDAGAAYCWGTLSLGDGGPPPASEQTTPVAVGGSLRFTAISADSYVTCALSTTGELYCWGGAQNELPEPTAVPTATRFTTISGGATRFCAIAVDQSVYCWIDDTAPVPTLVTGDYHFRAVSVGGPVICGLTAEGPEVCWGGKGLGNVGDGVVDAVTTAVPTPIAGQRIFP